VRGVDSYRQFCPLSKAAEILCERWTPLVLRELLLGSTHFNELMRGVPGMSPSLLSTRLRTLQRHGVISVERDGRSTRYTPTQAGRELEPMLTEMSIWGHRWVRTDYADPDLDSSYLMLDIRRSLGGRTIATDRRVVVEIVFPRPRGRRDSYWLIAEPAEEPDLCYLDPGYDVDVRMECDLRTLTMIWMGDGTWPEALGSGRIVITGRKDLAAKVPEWIGQNEIAAVERAS